MIIDSISFNLDEEFLLDMMRVRNNGELGDRLLELGRQAVAVARPKAAYREVTIDERSDDGLIIDGVKFQSRLLSENLPERAYSFVATCGTELEEWSRSFSDLLESFWLDGIMNLALDAAVSELESRLGWAQLSCMNPGGLPDWPLTEQRPLFDLLGDTNIGVSLTESCLLLPMKSVSGIYYYSEEQFCNCQLCPRENCPGRRVPMKVTSTP